MNQAFVPFNSSTTGRISQFIPQNLDEIPFKEENFFDLMTDLELEECLRVVLPVIKLEPNKYLIGTKVHQIQDGNGFIDLQKTIISEAKMQCLKISQQMDQKNQTFQETMLAIIKEKRANPFVTRKFIEDSKKVQMPFQLVIDAVKERENLKFNTRNIGGNVEEAKRSSSSMRTTRATQTPVKQRVSYTRTTVAFSRTTRWP